MNAACITTRVKTQAAMIVVIATLFCLQVAIAADMPRKGTFSATFGYFAIVKSYEIDKGHVVIVGEWSGTSFNSSGAGIFHGAGTMCPGIVDILPSGNHRGHGYCTFTDSEGDKAFSTWECEGKLPCRGGTATFKGGTGKYAGMRGDFTWDSGGMAAPTPSGTTGYNTWRGSYELP